IDDFNVAISLNPKASNIFANMAWAKYALKNLESALSDCNKALDLNSNDVFALKLRRHIYLRMHQSEKSKQDFEKLRVIEKSQNLEDPKLKLEFQRYIDFATNEL